MKSRMARETITTTDKILSLLCHSGPMTQAQIVALLPMAGSLARNCIIGLLRRHRIECVGKINRDGGGLVAIWGMVEKPDEKVSDTAGIIAAALASRTDLERAWI